MRSNACFFVFVTGCLMSCGAASAQEADFWTESPPPQQHMVVPAAPSTDPPYNNRGPIEGHQTPPINPGHPPLEAYQTPPFYPGHPPLAYRTPPIYPGHPPLEGYETPPFFPDRRVVCGGQNDPARTSQTTSNQTRHCPTVMPNRGSGPVMRRMMPLSAAPMSGITTSSGGW